MKYRWVCKI